MQVLHDPPPVLAQTLHSALNRCQGLCGREDAQRLHVTQVLQDEVPVEARHVVIGRKAAHSGAHPGGIVPADAVEGQAWEQTCKAKQELSYALAVGLKAFLSMSASLTGFFFYLTCLQIIFSALPHESGRHTIRPQLLSGHEVAHQRQNSS